MRSVCVPSPAALPPPPPRSDKERARGDREAWQCRDNKVGLLDRGERFVPK
jgi:hypothetical protein